MENNKLLVMAENICKNFSAYSEEYQINSVSRHLDQFWTPAMRKELQDYLLSNPQKFSVTLTKALQPA